MFREEMECMKDWAMVCLGKLEGEARKNTKLRVIKLTPTLSGANLDSVRVEEYQVQGLDSEDP